MSDKIASNDLNECINYIEEAITKKYIKYYEYKNFHNIEKIRNSTFGEIYCANLKNSEQYFALKSFNLDKFTIKEIVNEFELHRKVNFHDNIIQFFGFAYKENQNNQVMKYLLVVEYVGNNSFQKYLKENFKKLTWEDKYKLAYQLTCVISLLHDEEIFHCDLNSMNILVYENTIKLVDFGLSKRIFEASKQQSDLVSMIPYVDPKKFVSSKPYSLNKKSDVYSIGVILWEISSGQKPFKEEIYDANLATQILQGYREIIVPDTPIDYSNLYIECWSFEPDDRPDMIQVVAKLKEIITKSVNCEQSLSIQQFNNVENIHINDNNLLQVIQNFDKIDIKEIEPNTQNINKYIFEEDLSFVVDELVNLYFKKVNEGKEEKMRKQTILNYIDNNGLKLQEIHKWLINNQDDSNFYYLLGYFNFQGIIGEVNKQEAFELFQKAAKLGNNAAQYNLANMYIDGEGIDKNYKKAFELSLGLAEKEYSSGINLLGFCYKYGIGTDIDEQKTFESYQKAANLGNSNGLNNLGTCYEKGTGTDINEQKAFESYKKAADLGNSSGMNNLGYCYENGAGTDVNEQKAFEIYQKAAAFGNSYGINNLAKCYKYGIGTGINIQKAFELYYKAANLGNSCGMFNLGMCYENGTGTDISEQKAFEFYQKAANLGNSSGINNLACCYKNGVGTSTNEQKAFKLYQKSADLGNLCGMYNLGVCYEEGVGIEKDLNESIYWYSKSAAQGSDDAQDKLNNIFLNL
ncbi:kinase-like protein [Rhizophagus irregularis]|uniref:Kinase-like protein n=1 Tax=Rhizophagus irregularis TaxID=588596 RepID=A0A2N1MSS2_9GLOM|nr:kinase-like protein [Rhizophagus irregularis]